eukprot:COSAG04_NODE_399_length_14959_cov_28.238730_4_plen_124_part_00
MDLILELENIQFDDDDSNMQLIYDTKEELRNVRDDLAELKEENKKLKDQKQTSQYLALTWQEENEKLKEEIRNQGDQLVMFRAKEEKPDNPSSICAMVVKQMKDAEITELKEEIKKIKKHLKV